MSTGYIAEAVEAMEASDPTPEGSGAAPEGSGAASEGSGAAPEASVSSDVTPTSAPQALVPATPAETSSAAGGPIDLVVTGELVPASSALVPASSAEGDAQRRAMAENLSMAFGQSCVLNTAMMLMPQEEIQRHATALPQAPPFFRQTYNTQHNFSWAVAGFNPVCASFFRGGTENLVTSREICAGIWDSSGKVLNFHY